MMQLTQYRLILIASLGSVAMLGGAFLFQLAGYAPCQMCLWQRWPHAAAIVIGALALTVTPPGAARRGLAVLGALAALTTAGIGLYHSGVEQGWWQGPTSCSGGSGLDNVTDLLNTDIAPVVMCSDIVWSFMGLSMASYNALISLALSAVWLFAAQRR